MSLSYKLKLKLGDLKVKTLTFMEGQTAAFYYDRATFFGQSYVRGKLPYNDTVQWNRQPYDAQEHFEDELEVKVNEATLNLAHDPTVGIDIAKHWKLHGRNFVEGIDTRHFIKNMRMQRCFRCADSLESEYEDEDPEILLSENISVYRFDHVEL